MADLSKLIAAVRCPSRSELIDVAMAALPRGRAWQTNEGGPDRGAGGGFQKGAFQNDAFSIEYREASVLYQYWSAVAEFLTFAAQRFCALRLEFWCATKRETTDLWMEEYGLPDACDPFPDLCTKVAAIGGTRCEYYAEIAARAGWSIGCSSEVVNCGSRAGCRALAGKARPGRPLNIGTMTITVFMNESPAFQPVMRNLPPVSGRFRAGRRHSCGPDLTPLQCLLARVVHAEIKTVYEVNYGY